MLGDDEDKSQHDEIQNEMVREFVRDMAEWYIVG
jgi:hypothetical protein